MPKDKFKIELPELPSEPPEEIPRLITLGDIEQLFDYVTTAPTHIPSKFIDQIVPYDDGVNRRLYIYINGVWRYTSLT